MLTPQEILDVKFVKSVKGYDKDQVEDFLDIVHGDYTTLYKENATLKGKMRVLVDKIEEYRAVDEQMRKAFYNAQVTAQETVAKAEAEAEHILNSARSEAELKISDIQRQAAAEEKRLELAKQECLKYCDMMKQLLGENINYLDILMEKSALTIEIENADPKKGIQDKIASFELEIDPSSAETQIIGNIGEIASQEDVETPLDDTIELDVSAFDSEAVAEIQKAMENPTEVEKETVPPTRGAGDGFEDSTRFNLSELKFGKDYKEEE